MKSVRLLLVLGIAVVSLAWLVFRSSSKPADPTAPDSFTQGDLVIGEPIVFGNLSIFPVCSKTPRTEDRFITLDEGLKAGTVEILENGAAPENAAPLDAASTPAADPFAAPPLPPDSPAAASDLPARPRMNSVNELMVVNRSDRPLYLMPGEIIIGGSQDRTIGQELVVAPDQKPVALGVYCVEHGRWGSRDARAYATLLPVLASPNDTVADSAADFDGNLSLIVSETANVANAGKFVGSIGSLSRPARLAVHKQDGQVKVWEEVAAENDKNQTESASGTFATNYAQADSLERLTPYLDQLRSPVADTQNIVGVIVAVNGNMDSLDVFESTPLFKKLWPKLLKSYALDAVNADPGEETPHAAGRTDALAFLQEVMQAQAAKVDTTGDLALSQSENDRVLLFSAHERRNQDIGGPDINAHGLGGAGMMGGMGGGAFNGAIHSAGFTK